MGFWANLVGYQLVWFAAVIGAGHDHAWPGVVAALVLVAVQCAASRTRRSDLGLVLAALVLGMLIDGGLAHGGWLAYSAQWPRWNVAPAWILALWAAFAMTLNHSFAIVQRRPWLAALLGAIGGPLAYWGAARGLHALTFAAPAWRAALVLALAWGLALPMLALLAQRWNRTARTATEVASAWST